MNPILRNILAVITGWLVGSTVNMALINLGHTVYPIEGVDVNNMEALAAVMPTMGPQYFIFPFHAHALGTLVGAVIAAGIGVSKQMGLAMIIGGLFFVGGIMVNVLIPGPLWFTVLDLLLAYFPMAFLGAKLAKRIRKEV
jgi:hypothetical protein